MTEIIINENGAFLTTQANATFLSGGFGSEINKLIAEQDPDAADCIQKGSGFRAPLHARPFVEQVHAAYASAGADILTADSFNASMGRADNNIKIVQDHASAAADIATRVSNNHPQKPLVAMSLTSSGDCYAPEDTPDDKTLIEEHTANIQTLSKLGDFVIAETLPTLREAQIIAQIANEQKVPFIIANVVDEDGVVLDGSSMEDLIETILKPNSYCMAVGANCGDSIEGVKKAVSKLSSHFNQTSGLDGKQIIAYPNSFEVSLADNKRFIEEEGKPHPKFGQAVTPQEGREVIKNLFQRGAGIIGLCCGSTPEHTEHYVDEVNSIDNASYDVATNG